ncbi:MAG: DNA topoisomerase, partial [Cyanobacteria bacterium]|nr:DNA topoisomerase [Cyanobacteriota bacterium]
MRYTETRLAAISHEALLSEIGEATVDFIPNFDNSQQEPVVLPAQLPFLLLNGSSGIAVGMATNVPPHNLAEVVDGLIALIDRPSLPDAELFQLIPAPDFPTGGEIVSLTGVWDAYRTGRGSIVVRGITNLEQVQGAKGRRRDAIVVSELPYQVNKASWIEKVAELVNQGKIEGIADIRDESDRDGMRVVIDLKRESDPDKILEKLYKLTALQSTFGAIFLALVDGVPRQLSLRESLQAFLRFRETTLNRRYRHERDQASDRLHIVEGLLTALDNLDAVIDLLRQAPDGSTAEAQLQSRFNLSERQASAILGMPLRRLTGLERQKLYTERDELTQRMQELDKLLNDRRELLKAMKKDLRTLKRKYGDPRRTRLPQGEAAMYQEPSPEEPSPNQQEPETSTQELAANDQHSIPPTLPVPDEAPTNSDPTPIPMTLTHGGTGQAVTADPSTADAASSTVSAMAVPPTLEPVPSMSDAEDVLWACSIEPGQPARVSTPLPPPPESSPARLVTLDAEPETVLEFTHQGYVRRWSPKLYEQIHPSSALVADGAVVLPIVPEPNLSPLENWVIQAQLVNTQNTLWVVVSDGKLYPLPVSTIPLTSAATSQGRSLLTLLPGSAASADNTVVLSIMPPTADSPQPDLVLVSHQGRIKRMPLTEVAEVSGRGLMVMKLRENDRLAYATLLQPREHVILATSTGRILHLT